MSLNKKLLRAHLSYSPDTGIFIWLNCLRKPWLIGQPAGTLNERGYISIILRQTPYLAHRLAWFYMTGQWPVREIDHINGVRNDNRWSNLREATSGQNSANMKGWGQLPKGVSRISSEYFLRKPYYSKIMVGGINFYLGTFSTPEAAHAAYCAAATQKHGAFARFK